MLTTQEIQASQRSFLNNLNFELGFMHDETPFWSFIDFSHFQIS